MINGDKFERPYPTYRYEGIHPSLLDENAEIAKLADLPIELQLHNAANRAYQQLMSGLFIPEKSFETTVSASKQGTTISLEALQPWIDRLRNAQIERANLLAQIRQWVNDAQGGDPAPLDAMYEIAARFLFPEEMTWDYLDRRFMSTDQAWEELEMSLGGYSDTDRRMVCKSILYLMGREGEDGHGHV